MKAAGAGRKAIEMDVKDDYNEETLSEQLAVQRWEGHIELSKRGMKEKHEFYLWAKNAYETKFWGGTPGYKKNEPDRREVNTALTFIRAIQSAHYSQDPQVVCESQFQPPQIREMIGHLAEELLDVTDFREVSRQLFVDAGLYGMAAVQTGYKSEIAVDPEMVKKQEDDAQTENEKLAQGKKVSASSTDDHQTHGKIHGMYIQAITQQYQQRGEQLPPQIQEAFQAHMDSHMKTEAKYPKNTSEYIKSREVWATNLKVVDENGPLFGWEYGKPFKTARFVWREFYRPLAEVKRDDQLDPSRKDVKATATFHKDMLPQDMAQQYGSEFVSEVKLVRMFEIWDRGTNEHIIMADGHPKFLRKKTHPHKDILKAEGVHVLTFLDDADGNLWMSPLEAAAPQIVTINRGESIKNVVMNKSVPFKVYNETLLSAEDSKKIRNAKPGSNVGIKVQNVDVPVGNIFYDFQGFKISPDAMAAPASARADVGQLLGISDAARGGSEDSKTASAAQIVSGAVTQIQKEWASRVESFLARVVADLVQYVKNFYDLNTLAYTVGPMEAQALTQAFQTMGPLKARSEKLRVKSGTTMAGIEATLQQNIMALLQSVAQHPLIKQRQILSEVLKSFGFVPDRFMITEQEEAQRAQLQPGDQEEVVGGPDIEVDAPVQPGAGQAQSGAELQRAIKSKANKEAPNPGNRE